MQRNQFNFLRTQEILSSPPVFPRNLFTYVVDSMRERKVFFFGGGGLFLDTLPDKCARLFFSLQRQVI